MAYERILKIYEANGSSLDTSVYAGGVVDNCLDASFVLSCTGGCLGGKIVLPATDLGTDFLFDQGQVFKAFYDSGSSVYHSGIITSRTKRLEDDYIVQEYSTFGYWDEVKKARIIANSSYSHQTIGSIVNVLYNLINAASPLINSSEISCSVRLAEFTLQIDGDIQRYLQELAHAASSDGDIYAVGVDGAGKFFFKKISTSNSQATITVGLNAIQGIESGGRRRPRTKLITVGDFIGVAGYYGSGHRSKKTWIHDNASTLGYGKPLVAKLRGFSMEEDHQKFQQGWSNRYASSTLEVSGLKKVTVSDNTRILPWEGRLRYVHGEDTLDNYISSISVSFNDTCEYDFEMGFDATDGMSSIAPVDVFSPAVLDSPFYQDSSLDDLINLPDATDLTSPPLDYPFRVNQDILDDLGYSSEGGGGGPGGGGEGSGAAAGDVYSIIAQQGARPGDSFHVRAFVANGGEALAEDSIVLVVKQFDNTNTQIASDSKTMEVETTVNNIEIYVTPEADPVVVEMTAERVVLYVRYTIDPEADPVQYNWFPHDPDDDFTAGLSIRVIDIPFENLIVTNNNNYFGYATNIT